MNIHATVRRLRIALPVTAVFILLAGGCSREPGDSGTTAFNTIVLAEGVDVASTAGPDDEQLIRTLLASGSDVDGLMKLAIDYPLEGSVFPQEFVAPRFLWHDPASAANAWLIDVAFEGGSGHVYTLTASDPLPVPDIDQLCISENNELPKPTPYQSSAKTWLPADQVWETIKQASVERTATVTVYGFDRNDPERVLSRGAMTMKTSEDPVGAAIFYRDVPLMPSRSLADGGTIKPLDQAAYPLIKWRLKDVSKRESRVLLTDMPTCANCHSFDAGGETLALDIDGPQSDKGGYAIAAIGKNMVIENDDIISWNYQFHDKPKGQKTIGFLSQISPDGEYVVSTLNEMLYVENYTDYRFLQVFYPTRGILGYYSKETDEIKPLPGADDPAYVHCDAVWSPDGKYLIFARAEAKDPLVLGQEMPPFAGSPEETPMQYDLYRIPFNNGRGGTPERIAGASENGMSNTFPKVSWDGRHIVFVKCKNGQLMRPDGRLWIVPFEGGEAREMACNTSLMNSWHSFSPNSRWMVFSSKSRTPYTQMFLTHVNEDGTDSPAILIPGATADNRAVNIPEFVNIAYDDFLDITVPAVTSQRHLMAAGSMFEGGEIEEALTSLRQAIEENPDDKKVQADIYQNMGVALTAIGRNDEALEHFGKAVELDPEYSVAYVNSGIVLEQAGRHQEALAAYENAARTDPMNAKAFYRLNQLQMSEKYPALRDIDRAFSAISKACELTYFRNPIYLVTMANTYAESGNFPEAVRYAEIALNIASETEFSPYSDRIRSWLEHYRQGRTINES